MGKILDAERFEEFEKLLAGGVANALKEEGITYFNLSRIEACTKVRKIEPIGLTDKRRTISDKESSRENRA